jgi:hypothetical protein
VATLEQALHLPGAEVAQEDNDQRLQRRRGALPPAVGLARPFPRRRQRPAPHGGAQAPGAVAQIVKRSGKPLGEFLAAIQEVADELMDAYHGLDDKQWRGAGKAHFVQVVVVVGCFLLEIFI